MNDEMYELYKTNPDFHTYVDAHCRQRKLGLFEALSHAVVKEVGQYYISLAKEKGE